MPIGMVSKKKTEWFEWPVLLPARPDSFGQAHCSLLPVAIDETDLALLAAAR